MFEILTFFKKIMSQTFINKNEVDALIMRKISEHQPEILLDKEFFLDLLKHSLSLNVLEKQKVIDAIPTLVQSQFDELIKVFLEEREKFRELIKNHPEDVKTLSKQQAERWLELWNIYFMAEKTEARAKEDQAKIDELKASLWL